MNSTTCRICYDLIYYEMGEVFVHEETERPLCRTCFADVTGAEEQGVGADTNGLSDYLEQAFGGLPADEEGTPFNHNVEIPAKLVDVLGQSFDFDKPDGSKVVFQADQPLSFRRFGEACILTAEYPHEGTFVGLAYLALGLTGEAGEAADKIKKVWRNRGGLLTQTDREEILKELGDILWYVAMMSYELGSSPESVALTNIFKCMDRAKRSTINSQGDNR